MLRKLLDYYGSCKTSCLEHHYLQYLNRLLGFSLITVFLHMTRVINNTFHQKVESMHYSAALDITEAVRGSSREKLYPKELGLEYPHLFNNIPIVKSTCRTRNIDNISQFLINFFQKFIFPIRRNCVE